MRGVAQMPAQQPEAICRAQTGRQTGLSFARWAFACACSQKYWGRFQLPENLTLLSARLSADRRWCAGTRQGLRSNVGRSIADTVIRDISDARMIATLVPARVRCET